MKVALDKISINSRHRRDLGDVDALVASIEQVGLLHPVVLTKDYQLIAGERRIAAVRKLGWDSVEATIASSIDGALALLVSERDENTCRKDFSPPEAYAVGKSLEAIEKPKATERERSGKSDDGKSGGRGKKKPSGNLPEGLRDTRDKVAAGVGMSGRTYEKVKAVCEAAEAEPEKFGDLVTKMHETGKVNAAYGAMKHRKASDDAKRSGAMPDGKFRVFYADPPWSYGDTREGMSTATGAEHHYPSMSIPSLCDMPVLASVADDAVLFLWVTSPLLAECWPVIKAWGFEYKASFVWDKVKHNYGNYNSVRHELLLVCTRGSCLPENKKLVDSVQSIERTATHSQKPETFREIIDNLYPNGKRIELFARTKAKGWERWGDQS